MGSLKAPIALGFAVVLVSAWAASVSAADMVIGISGKARVHNDVGRAICRQIKRKVQDTTCEALPIEGRHAAEQLAVLSAVRNGAIEVGLVLSDWQYHAFQGTGPVAFMDVKFDNIHSLFSLHSEAFTVVARRDSGIDKLDDLAGKRVNIGDPGSGRRAVMEMVMKAKGWTRKTFQLADELTEAEQSLALCHNRVQAYVATVAHPNTAIAKTLKLCDAKIIPVSGPAIDKLIAGNRFFAAAEVRGGAYKNMKDKVKMFGVTLTAISSADIDSETIYSIVKTVFDDLKNLKRLHPALRNLLPDRMMTDGLSAPMHPGAIRYFRERGMM